MGGMSIGTYFGFRLRVHWSWLVIFTLFTVNLTAAFATLRPEWAGWFALVLATAAVLALFVSVLLHELAHAVVARSRGVPVRDVTLFLFGGAAQLEDEPTDPKTEFLFTIAGPIASLLIGIASLAAVVAWAPGIDWTSADAILQVGPAQLVLLWLGQVNLVLAAFNLVPGFPLDGGRILRSAVWAITGDRRRATLWATTSGRIVAFALIGTGIAMVIGYEVPVFGASIVGGIWLIVIGIFLNGAAIASYRQELVSDAFSDVRVAQVMARELPDVAPSATVDQLVHDRIMGSDSRCFLVRDDGAVDGLAGLVCIDDVRTVPRDRWTSTRVRDVMTPREQLVTVGPDTPAADALQQLARNDVDQLPVLQGDQVAGLVRRSDLMRWLQLQQGGRR
jgi:Zn-dependent protease/CBS domain-containing protein